MKTAQNTTPASVAAPNITAEELRQRVIYSLLLPCVRMARFFDVPLKRVEALLHMAYFHELKRTGHKMREAAGLLEVSMRKVALLSKQLKDNFLQPDSSVGLPRRIEFLLWAGPQSQARIHQALPDADANDVNNALSSLASDGRIRQSRQGNRWLYERTNTDARLVKSHWTSRIDGLNNLLGNVCHAVYGRFFADDDRSFARTVSFRVRPQDIPRLRELYQDVIWPALTELERLAAADDEAVSLDYSVCWAPLEVDPKGDES